MKFSKFDKEHAEESLRNLIHEGDTIYTILKHVSPSGMSRVIQLIIIKDNTPYYLGYNAACFMGDTYNHNHEGIKIYGCGMDMGFVLVCQLSYTLFGNEKSLKQRWL